MGIFDLFKGKKHAPVVSSKGASDLPLLAQLEKDAQTDDIAWVQYFNVKLGMDLGGIVGVFNAFSDAGSLMRCFVEILECDMAASRAQVGTEERQRRLRLKVAQTNSNEQELLMQYWDFFGDACTKVCTNREFAEWVHKPKNFTVMPDIFTHEILKLACKVTGR